MPYRTAELFARFLYSTIGDNPILVFALCEVCLMLDHPADGFYEMLVEMKRKGFNPNSESEIYDYVFTNIHEAGTRSTLLEVYDYQVDRAIEELSAYFTRRFLRMKRNGCRIFYLKEIWPSVLTHISPVTFLVLPSTRNC